jgi:hypothetical protein
MKMRGSAFASDVCSIDVFRRHPWFILDSGPQALSSGRGCWRVRLE